MFELQNFQKIILMSEALCQKKFHTDLEHLQLCHTAFNHGLSLSI